LAGATLSMSRGLGIFGALAAAQALA